MTTPETILCLLIPAASTAAGLGDTLRIPMLVAKALCERHEHSGLVTHTLIAEMIPLYHLTEEGKQRAAELQPATV
jgi:hypothetical protein